MTGPALEVPLYACAVSVLRVAVAAKDGGQGKLCRFLQDIAHELDQLGDEQADLRAGVDRLAQAIEFSAGEPWGASSPKAADAPALPGAA